MKLKNALMRKIFGYRASTEDYICYLKKIGVEIGEDVVIYRPMNTTIDIQNPHLLKIGNHVMITGPVTILTHDFSWSVLKHKYGDIVGNQRITILEDNIFVGWGSTILAGSHVGSNSIIGANSVVSGELEGNAVYAGNPAKKIMSLDEYYEKRKKKQLIEAVNYVKSYKETFGCFPQMEKLDEYFFLFFNPTDEIQKKTFDFKLHLLGNYEETITKAKNNCPMFSSYEEFLDYCKMQG